ncbi:MAG: biopolymer transporter ExbD [Pseudomonadota bacterium]
MSFTSPPRRRRRPSLTAMIDVVFLLLVFFMLASRFGADRALPMPLAGAGETWRGPPRLIDVTPTGLRLNGFEVDLADLPDALAPLVERDEDAVVLRGRDGATVQRLTDVMEALVQAGRSNVVLVE